VVHRSHNTVYIIYTILYYVTRIVSGAGSGRSINKTVCSLRACAEATRVIDVFRTADDAGVQVCVSVSAIFHVHDIYIYVYCT